MLHKSAVIDSKAKLGSGVKVGPYAIIDKGVIIGDKTEIGPYVRIKEGTKIGSSCKIYEGVCIGNPPQDIKFKGGKITIEVGNNNILREFVTIHGGSTVIGDNNFLMAYVHIAHNCKLGNGIMIANATQVSGFVEIEDYAFLSGLCPVHQFTRIGCYSMLAGGYRVPKDIIPYALASGDPLHIYGLNIIGLKRHKFTKQTIKSLKKAFKILLFSGLNTSQAITRIKEDLPPISEIVHLVEFIEKSPRGIAK